MSSGGVVVLGIMGRTPFAGVAWQVLHYLEGFRRLGCEVTYLEDTGAWPYDPERNTISDDPGFTVRYLERMMSWLGLPDRWGYVSPDRHVFGLSQDRVARALEGADAIVNLTGSTVLRPEHLQVPVRIYVETDPVGPQIEVAQGRRFTIELLAAHTHRFSYAVNLGSPDCGVPVERFDYFPTRQPVVLDWWGGASGAGGRYTTVASWRQTGRDVRWQGETYSWSKDREFLKLVDLPRRVGQPLELALACDDAEAIRLLESHGWRVVDAVALSSDTARYRDYIEGSRGEVTVAKDQNIRLRSGWFSDRSACYLAAGRPVVAQDTAFGNALPTGCGLFAFRTLEEAAVAIEAIESDYERNARAAREIAVEHFAADTVLSSLLERAGLGTPVGAG
jgi:hypothetical protein